ncbi:MAG TPA: SufD family Fe-S cluster assembly protein [Syntrophales bacterium]|jgi:Fe-S cluster assembly scaffold protein SufB|nr:SufD family Fe-S cluster assembly protein [Syntrophales bacterium]HOX94223.1 SufD family Fe-S cluster assembly protein [Syntrophales bacterium]HPI55971.1 SufD family Fe-S cluster assembly protein [Syntrophales bacterium]HPN24139.1 SufD family Fe-S cluster assembly protein [Syntrophales bacterium]HQM28418.1 SufD family Fe-S cluster assembly protein [Syntrophales bacterium]
MSEVKKRAGTAATKKAAYGTDIDLSSFKNKAMPRAYDASLNCLSEEEIKTMAEVGIVPTGGLRSGNFIQMNHSAVNCSAFQDGVEVMSSAQALEKFDGLKDYWWKAVDVVTDKYTAHAELAFNSGYFIKVKEGVKARFPVQACLYIGEEDLAQNVHNVVIAEEGSEIHVITGCTTAPKLKRGLHIGISEFYVKKGATLTFTMIHNWGERVVVRPRTAVWVEEGATYNSNFVCMKPARSIQMFPSVRLRGENAVTRLNSVLIATAGTELDIGGRVSLEAAGAKAEILTRTISKGGNVIARGILIGEKPGVKAHLECSGLMLSDEGSIRAIPELDGRVSGVEMSHEAAVGRISQEEIEYLMARGLSEKEATALIVRGFLRVEMVGLPEPLKKEIDRLVEESEKSLL